MIVEVVILLIKIAETRIFLDCIEGGSFVKLYVGGIPRTTTQEEVTRAISTASYCFVLLT